MNYDFEDIGDAYECRSPNNDKLWAILQRECREHGILCGTDSVFAYMREFESKQEQLTLFSS
jgi:hypothetical protein